MRRLWRRTGTYAGLAVGACALVLAACDRSEAPPTVAELQAAYARQAATSKAQHDSSLKIVGVDCAAAGKGRYLCQVGYKSGRQISNRVYIDAALFTRDPHGDWTLQSGLCRRADIRTD
jgi:hypothetical protein